MRIDMGCGGLIAGGLLFGFVGMAVGLPPEAAFPIGLMLTMALGIALELRSGWRAEMNPCHECGHGFDPAETLICPRCGARRDPAAR